MKVKEKQLTLYQKLKFKIMTELEFIEEIAEGNLTKNDIIKYAESVCDREDLLLNIFAHMSYLNTVNSKIIHCVDEHSVPTGEIKVENGIRYPEEQKRLSKAIDDIEAYFSISLFDDDKANKDVFLFPKIFDNDYCFLLYDFLKNNNLICNNTDYSDFQYWFRCNNKENPKPIVWIGTKQLARELLEYLFKERIKPFADIERIVSKCFINKKGEPMKLAKNKTKYSFESDAIKNFFSDNAIK